MTMHPSWIVALAAVSACGNAADSRDPAQPRSGSTNSALASSAPAGARLTRAAPVSASAKGPKLKRCPTFTREPDDVNRERTAPLAFPSIPAVVVATDRDHVAVATLDGSTQCIDSRWQEKVENATLSHDGRFFGYDWVGYEAYGYRMVDRTGGGVIYETGNKPVFSPGGRRMAAVEWTESGFGGLNAVLVLDVLPVGLKELARIEQLPEGLGEWRFNRWAGEDCFELSGIRFEDSSDGEVKSSTPRQRYVVRRRSDGWTIAVAPRGCLSR